MNMSGSTSEEKLKPSKKRKHGGKFNVDDITEISQMETGKLKKKGKKSRPKKGDFNNQITTSHQMDLGVENKSAESSPVSRSGANSSDSDVVFVNQYLAQPPFPVNIRFDGRNVENENETNPVAVMTTLGSGCTNIISAKDVNGQQVSFCLELGYITADTKLSLLASKVEQIIRSQCSQTTKTMDEDLRKAFKTEETVCELWDDYCNRKLEKFSINDLSDEDRDLLIHTGSIILAYLSELSKIIPMCHIKCIFISSLDEDSWNLLPHLLSAKINGSYKFHVEAVIFHGDFQEKAAQHSKLRAFLMKHLPDYSERTSPKFYFTSLPNSLQNIETFDKFYCCDNSWEYQSLNAAPTYVLSDIHVTGGTYIDVKTNSAATPIFMLHMSLPDVKVHILPLTINLHHTSIRGKKCCFRKDGARNEDVAPVLVLIGRRKSPLTTHRTSILFQNDAYASIILNSISLYEGQIDIFQKGHNGSNKAPYHNSSCDKICKALVVTSDDKRKRPSMKFLNELTKLNNITESESHAIVGYNKNSEPISRDINNTSKNIYTLHLPLKFTFLEDECVIYQATLSAAGISFIGLL